MQGGAAQGKRIVGAFGGQSGGEQAGQTVQPVGQRQGQPRSGLADGVVLFRYRRRHRFRFAAETSVLATHDSLQRSHLHHHVRRQICFSQGGGAAGGGRFFRRQSQHLRHLRRQLFQAVRLVQHGAKFGLEGERIQPGQKFLQFVFNVLAVEKFCVGKTGADDVFVAGHHHVQMLLVPVAHSDKVGQQTALPVIHGEIPLVFTHNSHQHCGGQFEVTFAETAAQRRRFFHQISHLPQQLRVVGDGATHFRRQLAADGRNHLHPLFHVQDDAVLAHDGRVIPRVGDR